MHSRLPVCLKLYSLEHGLAFFQKGLEPLAEIPALLRDAERICLIVQGGWKIHLMEIL